MKCSCGNEATVKLAMKDFPQGLAGDSAVRVMFNVVACEPCSQLLVRYQIVEAYPVEIGPIDTSWKGCAC